MLLTVSLNNLPPELKRAREEYNEFMKGREVDELPDEDLLGYLTLTLRVLDSTEEYRANSELVKMLAGSNIHVTD